MTLIEKLSDMQKQAENICLSGKKIGLVPTMGYLHEGHLSLIRIARKNCDQVITSIFVNPTQFGPDEDYENYPRDMERDCKLAEDNGTDIIFFPSVNEMYPDGYQTYVEVDQITQTLCGQSRPKHFKGVTTIVTKLFNLTKPHVAIFGQKDAQQAIVIKRMVKDLNMKIDIIMAPIVREADGLALSSRNTYLSSEQRKHASVLYRSLMHAKSMIGAGERNPNLIIKEMTDMINQSSDAGIDYIRIVDTEKLQPVQSISGEVLIAEAVRFGKTRLIDNIIIQF